ncbi:MAG: glycoside hydrolase family 25 protein [Lentimicrobium sp.]|nr:glycoside hydrolase family 25 protein [Lentimicrobium sp.]
MKVFNPLSIRKKKGLVWLYLTGGLLFIFILVFGPAIHRYAIIFRESGYSFSVASQYHNLKNFGVRVPRGYNVHGIDVSHHQGKINWSEVVAMDVDGIKIEFAFFKATEGITRKDRHFDRNWKEAGKVGLIRGAYHFFHPTRDAEAQALAFIQSVELEAGDMPPILDIEVSNRKSKKEIVEGALLWCQRVEAHYGVKPVIYTSPGFYDKYLADDFEDYPLWIAHYDKKKPRMDHRKWQFWQHSDGATINGIKGKVDMNVFNGSRSKLRQMVVR